MNGKSVLGIIFANIHEEALDTLRHSAPWLRALLLPLPAH